MDTNLELRKRHLISWIIELNDEKLLNRLESLKKSKYPDAVFEMTDEMKQAVDKAIESLDAGKGKTHEQVMEKARKTFPNLNFA